MSKRFFTAESYQSYQYFLAKLGLREDCCTYIREPYILMGLRDIKIEVLPGSFEHPCFQEIYCVAQSRNLKMEKVNV